MSSTIAGFFGRGLLCDFSQLLTKALALATCFVVSEFHSPESW